MNYFPSGEPGPMPSGQPVTGTIIPTNPAGGLTTHPMSTQIIQVVEHKM